MPRSFSLSVYDEDFFFLACFVAFLLSLSLSLSLSISLFFCVYEDTYSRRISQKRGGIFMEYGGAYAFLRPTVLRTKRISGSMAVILRHGALQGTIG